MSSTGHSRPGTRVTPATPKPDATLTFPAALVQPPQSQLVRYADEISDRIARLDLAGQRMGEGFGVTFTSFELNPPKEFSGDSGLSLLASTVQALTHKSERISLERRSGRWGLYFTRGAPVLAQDRRVSDTIPLKDAPLEIRERFLTVSEEFFRSYLQLCEDRLCRMKSAIGDANRTLELISDIRLS